MILAMKGMSFGVSVDALFSKMCNHTENGTGKKQYYRILLYGGRLFARFRAKKFER